MTFFITFYVFFVTLSEFFETFSVFFVMFVVFFVTFFVMINVFFVTLSVFFVTFSVFLVTSGDLANSLHLTRNICHKASFHICMLELQLSVFLLKLLKPLLKAGWFV